MDTDTHTPMAVPVPQPTKDGQYFISSIYVLQLFCSSCMAEVFRDFSHRYV